LSSAIKKARLRVERYLVETDGSKTKALKDMAALNASFGYKQSSETNINFSGSVKLDLGDLSKWGK
jgi:hypothetical protein